jgi:hypothetical protein
MQASNRRVRRARYPEVAGSDTVFSPRRHGGTEEYTEKDERGTPGDWLPARPGLVDAWRNASRGGLLLPATTRRAALGMCGLVLLSFLAVRIFPVVFHRPVAPPPRRPVAPSLTGPAPFTVAMNHGAPSVELSPALRQAVRRRWPGYRLPPAAAIPREALEELRQERPEARVPYAVIGDFNGDRRADAALLLRRGRRALLVALHGTPDGRFDGRRLLRAAWSDGLYITCQPPGRLEYNRYQGETPIGAGTLTLLADGIRFNAVDSAARVYYCVNGVYQQVELGD